MKGGDGPNLKFCGEANSKLTDDDDGQNKVPVQVGESKPSGEGTTGTITSTGISVGVLGVSVEANSGNVFPMLKVCSDEEVSDVTVYENGSTPNSIKSSVAGLPITPLLLDTTNSKKSKNTK